MTLNKVMIILICSCCLLYSCERPGRMDGEIIVLENLLIEKTAELQKLRSKAKKGFNASLEGKLVHIVFFNLKSGIKENEVNQFLEIIDSLKGINSVENLIYGDYLEVGDGRAMKEMELVMQLVFKDIDGLKTYQTDSIHLKVKKSLSPFLESAPVTYDYTVSK